MKYPVFFFVWPSIKVYFDDILSGYMSDLKKAYLALGDGVNAANHVEELMLKTGWSELDWKLLINLCMVGKKSIKKL